MNPNSHTRTAEATFGYAGTRVTAKVHYHGIRHVSPTVTINLPGCSPTLAMNTELAQHTIQNLSGAIAWVEEEVKNLKF